MIGVFKQVHFKTSTSPFTKPLNQTLISFELAPSSHPSFRVIAAIKTWTLHFSSTLDENSLKPKAEHAEQVKTDARDANTIQATDRRKQHTQTYPGLFPSL